MASLHNHPVRGHYYMESQSGWPLAHHHTTVDCRARGLVCLPGNSQILAVILTLSVSHTSLRMRPKIQILIPPYYTPSRSRTRLCSLHSVVIGTAHERGCLCPCQQGPGIHSPPLHKVVHVGTPSAQAPPDHTAIHIGGSSPPRHLHHAIPGHGWPVTSFSTHPLLLSPAVYRLPSGARGY